MADISLARSRSTSKTASALSNGSLAGSVLTMDRAVRNVTKFSNWSLRDAVRAATLNPARAVGMAKHHGVLAPGADADFMVLSSAGEVMKTSSAGADSSGNFAADGERSRYVSKTRRSI